MSNPTETETYKVTLRFVVGEDPRERIFRTEITIPAGAPFTDVSDLANEQLAEKHPESEVLSEQID